MNGKDVTNAGLYEVPRIGKKKKAVHTITFTFLEFLTISRNLITPDYHPASMGPNKLHHFIPQRGFDLRNR
jgi:hypothetical protein